MTVQPCLLVLAKAPVPGFAKTRLCPPATPHEAATIAAAGLLDTIDAVLGTGLQPIIALAGDLTRAVQAGPITAALRRCTVIPQRGTDLAERIVHAHLDAAALAPGAPILHIGSDTPQVSATELAAAAARLLADGCDAALGPATDGGWWALGLRQPRHASALLGVQMSTPFTGRATESALAGRGLTLVKLPELSDVDTIADAHRVSGQVPASRFAQVVATIGTGKDGVSAGRWPVRR